MGVGGGSEKRKGEEEPRREDKGRAVRRYQRKGNGEERKRKGRKRRHEGKRGKEGEEEGQVERKRRV